jgi:hypothetical protein
MLQPAPGWAIVRIVPPGTTAGGIVIPDTEGTSKVVLVRASNGHFKAGVFVACEIPEGSRLLMLDGAESGSSPMLPPQHGLIQLHDILAYEPPQATAPQLTSVQ